MKYLKIYRSPKNLEKIESCQDAYKYEIKNQRYAIADGATREFFSGSWANYLVENFCDNNSLSKDIFYKKNFKEWLEPIQKKWLAILTDKINSKNVNFIVKNRYNKCDLGASTFIGLELNPDLLEWKAIVIGDSCLFHIRKNKIIGLYLIKKSSDFDNNPNFFLVEIIKILLNQML